MTNPSLDTGAGTPPGLVKQVEWQINNAYANGHRDGLSCGVESAGLGFTGCEHLTDDAARSRPATDPAGLDVERLAEALRVVSREVLYPGDKQGRRWRSSTAEMLTAEYARLSVADGPGREERPALEAAAREVLGAFYLSPGLTTGRQAKAIDALRAALAALADHREETGR